MQPSAKPLEFAGGVLNAIGTLDAGNAQQVASQSTAAQYVQNAGQVRAAGQMQGEDEQLKSKLLQSRILAIAGASGAGVADPTIVNLVASAKLEGDRAAAMRRFNAENQAQGLEKQAAATLYEGDSAKRASQWKTAGNVLSMAQLFA